MILKAKANLYQLPRFKKIVNDDIEEEEDEMFPEAEEVLGERLERIGQQMQERKQQLTASLK